MATRLDPFRDLERLFNQTIPDARTTSVMPMDLYRTGDHYVMRIDLPGADPGSVDVSLDDRMLTIRGQRTLSSDNSNNGDGGQNIRWLVQERASGSFARQVALGPGVSVDGISATYDDGVLVVTVPVAQEAKPRRIEVAHQSDPRNSDAGDAVGADHARQSIDAG
ncbi:MAG: Hsp20/alpha crystallin family protein [Nakamurella sp.]